MKKTAAPVRRRGVPPIVAAVVQPVAKRLSRIEALLFEMRHEQDVKLRRIVALEAKIVALTEFVQTYIRRSSKRRVVSPQPAQAASSPL
jgi:hypothetical protein